MDYGADTVSVVVNDTPITGFADGTFVTATRDVESATKHVGADGKATKVRNADKSGTIVIRLAQTSPSNAVLSALEAIDATFHIIIKDTAGTDISTAAEAWVNTMPSAEHAQELSMREWTIQAAALVHYLGGAPSA